MKVLITAKVHGILISTFHQHGYEVIYEPGINYQELLESIGDITGLVVTTRLKIDKAVLDQAGKLKWIGRLGSGMEMIDLEYAKFKGINCLSSPEGNRTAVAEHTLGLLLNITKKIDLSHSQLKDGKWIREENRGVEISGKTVGIIGYGNTGQAFAKLLAPFNISVLAYDKYRSDFSENHVHEASLEQICKFAHVISFHVPLTDETHHMGNKGFFDSLKLNPIILNTSRGKVIQLSSLCDAIKNGKVSGAGLDVLENENLEKYTPGEKELLDWFLKCPEVVITPHIAGYSQEAFLNMSKVLIQKLQLD